MPRAVKESIPPQLRWGIWERDNFTCHYCGARKPLAIDHKVPESKGGPTIPENLLTACVRCNSRKGSKSYEEFIEELRSDPVGMEPASLPDMLADGRRSRCIKKCKQLSIGEAESYLGEQAKRLSKLQRKLTRQAGYLLSRHGAELRRRLDEDVPDAYKVRRFSRKTGNAFWMWVDARFLALEDFIVIVNEYRASGRDEEADHAYDVGLSRLGEPFREYFRKNPSPPRTDPA